jgi:hypothetical protein
VYRPALVDACLVPQYVHVAGVTVQVDSVAPANGDTTTTLDLVAPSATEAAGPTERAPLGRIVGARSGDKGGDANLGVFARTDAAYEWLAGFLTVDRLRVLLPEAADLPIARYELPAIRSLNFVVSGLLEEGVAASTRQDAQAKSLGEWLRARVVDVPVALL